MKKLFSFLAIIGIIVVSNCTQIPENNDPVIGIWVDPFSTASSIGNKNLTREEWIFNDAFLGRYHRYENKVLTIKTDFKWSNEDGTYTISYPGTELPEQHAVLENAQDPSQLKDEYGNVIAVRE